MLAPLPVQSGVRYVVSWQMHADLPVPDSISKRGDVEIHRLGTPGLSNNRNNSIENSSADIILIADDDLEYHPDFAKKIIDVFEKDPTLDLATFKVNFLSPKVYPVNNETLNIPLPQNYYVCSIEMAFRKKSIKDLRFYPELGLGAQKMHCGEEEFFLLSAIRRGLNCQFFPKEICAHNHQTTGDFVTPEILRGQGFTIKALYDNSAFFRILLKTWRIKNKKGLSLLKKFRSLMEGRNLYQKTQKKIPKEFKW